jgi:hypothetical protein
VTECAKSLQAALGFLQLPAASPAAARLKAVQQQQPLAGAVA